MIGTLALLASWTAGAARASHCVDRQRGCSGHGECRGGASCKCDPLFHGDRCDVWRSAPSADLTELQNVDWINCTHGRSTNGTGVDQHCDFENKSVCEAAGAPTVPQTCANEDMFLICDYTGCYSKPFCEGFLPPGYTPPGRNPQPVGGSSASGRCRAQRPRRDADRGGSRRRCGSLRYATGGLLLP
jgi:hypothetical protein